MATFDDVRRIALGLPEVHEKPHFGMPAFRVADKGFVSVTKDHSRVLLYLDPAAVAAELALGDCQQLTHFDLLIGLDADLAALDAARLDWSWSGLPGSTWSPARPRPSPSRCR